MWHIITLLFILSFTIHAEELFTDPHTFHLGHKTFMEEYCKSIKAEKQLCEKKKLRFLDYKSDDLPAFLAKVGEHITPILSKYNKQKMKRSVLSNIKDFEGDVSGEWYNALSVDLFSKTSATYTLSETSSGYTGGAHGYYGITFSNYDTRTQKKLTLDDLLLPDYNQTLQHIAFTHYKEARGLKPTQTLLDDGWFNNKFELAENFAVTDRGLYFLYNQYEVKSYADGITTFMLPYSKIRSLIDPKGALGFALGKNRKIHASFYEAEKLSIIFDAKVNADKTLTVTAKMTNLTYSNARGWLSLSFPQMQYKKAILKMQKKGFTHLQAYPKGSSIYNIKQKKALPANYLLVEAEKKKWHYNDACTLTLTISLPANSSECIIDIRGSLKAEGKNITLPEEYEGVKGQQNFTNYRLFVGM